MTKQKVTILDGTDVTKPMTASEWVGTNSHSSLSVVEQMDGYAEYRIGFEEKSIELTELLIFEDGKCEWIEVDQSLLPEDIVHIAYERGRFYVDADGEFAIYKGKLNGGWYKKSDKKVHED